MLSKNCWWFWLWSWIGIAKSMRHAAWYHLLWRDTILCTKDSFVALFCCSMKKACCNCTRSFFINLKFTHFSSYNLQIFRLYFINFFPFSLLFLFINQPNIFQFNLKTMIKVENNWKAAIWGFSYFYNKKMNKTWGN